MIYQFESVPESIPMCFARLPRGNIRPGYKASVWRMGGVGNGCLICAQNFSGWETGKGKRRNTDTEMPFLLL